ncbi:MAG: hypothetical protein ACXWDS_04300 [Actinomycetota bacterium]
MAVLLALGACGPGTEAADPPVPSTEATDPGSTPTVQDVLALEDFAPLEPGTYFIDPDFDPTTPLRVLYEVPVEGWSMWIGAAKIADDGHVGVSIATVTNLVSHGCRDHSPADPPVGPGVDDLATALADLAPFHVTSPPTDVTVYGYGGKHLELTVPELPVEGSGDDTSFTGCTGGDLMSWIGPQSFGAFYGYSGPGYTEELWILDVEGTRLVIAAERSPGSPRKDLAELSAILDSIRIEA